jgi:hypothetical protein
MDMESNSGALSTRSPDSDVYADEETLIEDHRQAVRPAQCVDQKLAAALQAGPLLVSQLQKVERPHDR